MVSQLTILFNYEEFVFFGHVNKYRNDGTPIYYVFYGSISNPNPIETVQIYRGLGSGKRAFWRQRASDPDPYIIDPELVEIIGKAIQVELQEQ